jgi:hypothetical protein
MLSRAELANSSNGDSEDDEDVSSSSTDEDDPFSDDEDEDYCSDQAVDRDLKRGLAHSTSSGSAQTGRGAPTQVYGTRSSARLAGELLPSLHSIGLYNNQAKVSRFHSEYNSCGGREFLWFCGNGRIEANTMGRKAA